MNFFFIRFRRRRLRSLEKMTQGHEFVRSATSLVRDGCRTGFARCASLQVAVGSSAMWPSFPTGRGPRAIPDCARPDAEDGVVGAQMRSCEWREGFMVSNMPAKIGERQGTLTPSRTGTLAWRAMTAVPMSR